MRIDATRGEHPVGQAAPEPQPVTMAVDRTDVVAGSDLARALVRAVGRVDEDAPDPARAAQVEILRNAVATGRYQPDPMAVARALLLELWG